MCLILFAHKMHPDYRLVIGANRDEFFNRPTRGLHIWPDKPGIIAGRDLKGGGTWLGVSENQRFAAITNYRNPADLKPRAPSRGKIIIDYLESQKSPREFLSTLATISGQFNGFNLILSDREELFYFSSQTGESEKLEPGFYGLSNHLLNTPWPKAKKGMDLLEKACKTKDGLISDNIFRLLTDSSQVPDRDLPHTGVELEWERLLSPIFIQSREYGTRSSTAVLMDLKGKTRVIERNFNPMETTHHEEIQLTI